MSHKLEVNITCSNGYFEERHRYFIPIVKVIDWCDEKYGVRKLNKDIEVVSVSLLDANHTPIEIDVQVSESVSELSEVSDTSEASAFLAAMRDMGSYDDDLTLSEVGLFDKEDISICGESVDPDDHWN